MSAIEVHPDADVEANRESVRDALKQEPVSTPVNTVVCPVCNREFDPRGIAPHMDAHRRAIGDLKPRQRRPKAKLRSVVIEPAAKPEPLLVLRSRIKDHIERIAELEHAAGIEEEFGPGTISRLQAKRHGLGIALDILDAL